MSALKLDLEFEDDKVKGQSDALDVDIDLSFTGEATQSKKIQQVKTQTETIQGRAIPKAITDTEADDLSNMLTSIKDEIEKLKEDQAQRIDFITNAKLLEFQVDQILVRINKKSPENKTELLMIKKYMNEFIKKIKA